MQSTRAASTFGAGSVNTATIGVSNITDSSLGALTKDWKINESIDYCIKLILSKKEFIMDDPFKTCISSLRRKEFLRGISRSFISNKL
jgi:hypothetical protein